MQPSLLSHAKSGGSIEPLSRSTQLWLMSKNVSEPLYQRVQSSIISSFGCLWIKWYWPGVSSCKAWTQISKGACHSVSSRPTPSNSLSPLRTLSSVKSGHSSRLAPFHPSSCHSVSVASNKVYPLSSTTNQWPQAEEMRAGHLDKSCHISTILFLG